MAAQLAWLAPAAYGAGQSLYAGLTTGWGTQQQQPMNFFPMGQAPANEAATKAAEDKAAAERKAKMEQYITTGLQVGMVALGIFLLVKLFQAMKPRQAARRWWTKRRTRR